MRQTLKYDSDRTVDSTENNEYAEGYRDENFGGEEFVEENIPLSEYIPDGVDEESLGERPIYDEYGAKDAPYQ